MNLARRLAVAVVCLGVFWCAAIARQAPAPTSAPATAPALKIQFDISPLIDCYFYLRTYSKDSGRSPSASPVDVTAEATVFTQAQTALTDQAGWRWVDDQVVTGPDPNGIRDALKGLPPALDTPTTRSGIGMLVDGLDSAYPKFLSGLWPERQRSLTRMLAMTRRKYAVSQNKIAPALMEKMGFDPIDAPIVIYSVIKAGSVSSWGKTSSGYYTVIGLQGVSSEQLIETGIHEATHIIDALQPYNSKSILKQIRTEIGLSDPAETDLFIHGLIAYNAGSLVKRFIDHDYQLSGIRSPGQQAGYAPYLSTWDLVWNQYLDGKIDSSKAVSRLVEEFKAVRKLEAAKKKPA